MAFIEVGNQSSFDGSILCATDCRTLYVEQTIEHYSPVHSEETNWVKAQLQYFVLTDMVKLPISNR